MPLPSASPFAGLDLRDDDSFRLLELQPGEQSSPIIIRLIVSNLTTAPPYEALSYAWGDPNETEAVQIKSLATETGPTT